MVNNLSSPLSLHLPPSFSLYISFFFLLSHFHHSHCKNLSTMEIARPQPLLDFDFNDARPMPFLSAPSTPKRFGHFSLTAPSSPRSSDFYGYFDDDDSYWEQKPPTPYSPPAANDFAFDFKSDLEENSLSAEELFDGGKIRPLKPPPRLQVEERNPLLSPRSPRSPIAQGKKMIRDVFSPKKKESDPFQTAAENTIKRMENERGRRNRDPSRREARSLSPYRVSEYPWEEEERRQQESTKQSIPYSSSNSKSAAELAKNLSNSSKSSSRKWRLKDFLLFRSASEGRASDKDRLNKYHNLFFRKAEDTKNSSYRSTESSGSVSGRRKKGQVSAHELHYTANKAASQDLKKTFLPYRYGILGRFAFNPRE